MLNSGRVDRPFGQLGPDTTSVMQNDRCPYRPGDIISGRYDVRATIGADPLFTTLAGSDQKSGHEVMILVVNSAIISSASAHERFLDRAQVLLSLDVPGLACAHRIIFQAARTLIVYEHVRGLPLRKLIERNRRSAEPIDQEEAMMLLRAIATALDQASQRSAHGYLIPEHVILRDDGLKLVATGLIAALPDSPTLFELNRSEHAGRYMAPEALSGRLGGPGADMYSLARIAEDLLSGSPFQRDGTQGENPLRDLPQLTIDLINGATAADSGERRGRLTDFIEALEFTLKRQDERLAENSADDLEGPTVAQLSPDLTVKTNASALDKVLRELDDEEDPSTPSEDELLQEEASFMEETIIDVMAEEHAKNSADEEDEEEEENIYDTLPIPMPEQSALSDESQDSTTKRRIETPSALGLDPQLVKAARRLDDARSKTDAGEKSTESQPLEGPRYVPPSPIPTPGGLSITESIKGIPRPPTHTDWPIVRAPIINISSSFSPTQPQNTASSGDDQAKDTANPPVPPDGNADGARQPWLHDTARVEVIPELLSGEDSGDEDNAPTEELQDLDPSDSTEPDEDQTEWTRDTDKIAALPEADPSPTSDQASPPAVEKEDEPTRPHEASMPASEPELTPAEPPAPEPVSKQVQESLERPDEEEDGGGTSVKEPRDSYHSIEISIGEAAAAAQCGVQPSAPPEAQVSPESASTDTGESKGAEVPPETSEEPVSSREDPAQVVDVSNTDEVSSIVPRARSSEDIPLAGNRPPARPRPRPKPAPMIPTASVKWSWALIGALLGGLLLIMYLITFIVIWALD